MHLKSFPAFLCLLRLGTCTFFCEMGHERASLGMCIAQHLHVHRSAQQLPPRRAYRETRRASQLSGAFSDSERALSSMKWEMDAQACVHVCACVCARVPVCGTGMTQIRRLFWLGAPAFLHFAELFRHADARPSTAADKHCRPSGSGATISLYRPQAFFHQAGRGFSSSKNFRSSADIAPSLPGQRFSLKITGVSGHFLW